MAIVLLPSDFECIGELAKHCDNAKLCVAIDKAQNFDLKPLLCDLYDEVAQNWDSEDTPWVELINGTTYESCNGKTTSHLGLKRVLIYYSYARYLMDNQFNDTPNGSVTKTNSFSIPKPYDDIKRYTDEYRNMGYRTFKEVERWLCLNRDLPEFTDLNTKDCKACGCNDLCNRGTTVKGYGIRGRNISKGYGM